MTEDRRRRPYRAGSTPALVALLAGCGGPPAPPPVTPTPIVVVDVAPPRPPARVAIEPPLRPLDLPAHPTCVLHGDPIEEPRPLPLRLHPGGPPFAFARPARGDVHFFSMTEERCRTPIQCRAYGGNAIAEVDVRASSGVRASPTPHLRALVASEDVDVYSQRPLFMASGVVSPKAETPLSVEFVSQSTLVFRLDDPAVHLAADMGPGSPEITREGGCGDVALSPHRPPFVPLAARVGARVLARAGLAGQGPLRLTVDQAPREGSAVYELVVPPDRSLALLEARGRRALVRCELTDAWVVGWVDRSALAVPFAPPGVQAPVPPPATLPATTPAPTVVRCDHDVPLEVRLGDERRAVGTAPAGTPLGIVASEGAYATVVFPSAEVVVAPGAAIRAETASVRECASTSGRPD